jgi:hypothetical protein
VTDPSRELANCGTTGCGVCQDGQCILLGDNNDCTDRPGVCCGGICREDGECCDDAGCPACQRCAANRCEPDPNQLAADCGESGCAICQDGQCVALGNNSDCTDREGVCCDGECKETCDDPCGPGYRTCQLEISSICCPTDAPCCPGNNLSPDKCQTSFGVCCPLGTHQCEHLCCAADELCDYGRDPDRNQPVCCPQGQSPCAGQCCPVGLRCYPDGASESCRERL